MEVIQGDLKDLSCGILSCSGRVQNMNFKLKKIMVYFERNAPTKKYLRNKNDQG